MILYVHRAPFHCNSTQIHPWISPPLEPLTLPDADSTTNVFGRSCRSAESGTWRKICALNPCDKCRLLVTLWAVAAHGRCSRWFLLSTGVIPGGLIIVPCSSSRDSETTRPSTAAMSTTGLEPHQQILRDAQIRHHVSMLYTGQNFKPAMHCGCLHQNGNDYLGSLPSGRNYHSSPSPNVQQ